MKCKHYSNGGLCLLHGTECVLLFDLILDCGDRVEANTSEANAPSVGGRIMSEPKPCPFCGNGNVRLLIATDSYRLPILRGHRAVVCGCGAMVFASTDDIAIAKWNRRSNDA